MCGFVWTWPENFKKKQGKNYKGWFCYTFGITPAFDLKHRDTGDFTHGQMAVAHGEERFVLSMTDFSKVNLPRTSFHGLCQKEQKYYP